MGLLDDDTQDQTDQASQDYGTLFGGAGQSFLQPFMGEGGQRAAMDNSLMNMGAAMMQASGKSFDPSHSSFLSSLGAGIGAGQTAYQGSIQRGLQAASAAQSLRANQLAYAQNLMFMRLAAGMNPEGPVASGAQPSVAAQVAPPSPNMAGGFVMPTANVPGNPSSTPMPSGNGAGGGAAPGTNGQPAGSGAGGPVSGGMGDLVMPGMSTRTAAIEMLGNRTGYLTALANASAPTDLMKTLRASGIQEGSPEWNQALAAETARTTAPQVTRLSNGSYVQNGQFVPVPNAEGLITQPDGQGGWTMAAVPGAASAQTQLATARAAGPATFKTVQTMGPNGVTYATPQTINAQNAGAYTPPAGPTSAVPMSPVAAIRRLESSGAPNSAAIVNPASGARSAMQVLPSTGGDPGFGIKPSNGTPEDDARVGTEYYGKMQQRYGNDAAAALAYTWGPGNVDTWLKNGADPAQVPADKVAYVRKFMGLEGQQQPQGGAAPAPQAPAPGTPPGLPTSLPVGAPQRAQESQKAAAESMQKDYEGMQSFRQAAPMQLNALNKMLQIARTQKTPFSVGPLGDSEAAQDNPFNPAPGEYEKQRANYLQTAGTVGTDAQRATQAHSLPDYGKPRDTIIQGIQTQIQQVQQGMLRANYLTPAYNSGDASKYTQAANDFDQHVTPPMAPILMMSGPGQRAAVQAAVKANPSLRPNFEWAFNNGMLK